MSTSAPTPRTASRVRRTSESTVELELNLDGTGASHIDTSVPFFDHMLTAFAKHSLTDLTVRASGDTHIDAHHTVEDVSIVLGQAILEALGDKSGISRYGDALVPLDEALAQAVVDISGRPYLVHTGEPEGFEHHLIGGLHRVARPPLLRSHHVQCRSHGARACARRPRPASHRGSGVQGVRACVPSGQGAGSARRRHSVHQGRAVTSAPRVAVFDYESGNVHSAVKALVAAGADAVLTRDRTTALEADGLVVPGVGAFQAVRDALRAHGGDEIIDRRLAGGRPVLGICVGMQVLFEHGVERGRDTAGLGEWPGAVTELNAPVLPHMGWNTVAPGSDSVLFRGIEQERFYFVHSYAAQSWQLDVMPPFPEPVLTWTTYGDPFLAAVENGPLSATQFHPEKSGEAGIQLLRNWVESL